MSRNHWLLKFQFYEPYRLYILLAICLKNQNEYDSYCMSHWKSDFFGLVFIVDNIDHVEWGKVCWLGRWNDLVSDLESDWLIGQVFYLTESFTKILFVSTYDHIGCLSLGFFKKIFQIFQMTVAEEIVSGNFDTVQIKKSRKRTIFDSFNRNEWQIDCFNLAAG